MSVTISEAAARHVTRYLAKRGKGVGVRLGVKTTGCSGLAYKLEYADEIAPEDVVFEENGVKVLVDFAHNPHGVAAIAQLVAGTAATRRLVLLGQAGDRTDAEIRALAAAVWAMRPERIVLKEMESYLRGRAPGEVPALLRDELGRLGAPADIVTTAESETDAVRSAFVWALPGDLREAAGRGRCRPRN